MEAERVDRITIGNIVAQGRHGALEGERDRAQPFHIAVELELDLTRAGVTDELHDTVNYADVYRTVVRLVEERSFRLLERLASAVLDDILRDPRIVSAEISIAKPGLLDGATPCVVVRRKNRAR